MLTKAGKDVKVDQITPENYLVKKGSDGMYHLKLEHIDYDSKGNKLSRPIIQTFQIKEYAMIKDLLKIQGYDSIVILHDPIEWKKQKEAELILKQKEEKEEAELLIRRQKELEDRLIKLEKAKTEPEKKNETDSEKAKTEPEKKNEINK